MGSHNQSVVTQALEARRHLSAVLTGTELLVEGTALAEAISVTLENEQIVVRVGTDETRFSANSVGVTRIYALDGDDLVGVFAGVKAAFIDGGTGNDTIFGGAYADTLVGGAGDDVLDGGSRDDQIDAGPGLDRAYGQGGNDTLLGGEDKDYLYGGRGNDLIDGQSGQDFLFGGADSDTIFGGGSNDRLNGEAGNDSLFGQKHDDLLDGGGGADLISGSSGVDVVSYPSRPEEVTVTPQPIADKTGNNDGEPGEADFVVNDVEGYSSSAPPSALRDGSGDDRAWLQTEIDNATRTHKPIVLKSGGHYRVSGSLILKSGIEFTTDGGGWAFITANGSFPIFKLTSNVENIIFRNLHLRGLGQSGVTGIGGDGTHQLSWSLIDKCTFYTTLAWGIDTPALGLTVRDSGFGTGGDLTSNHRHVRIRGTSGGGGCNMNTFDNNRFYNASGANALEFSGGFRWTFRSNVFEINRVTGETIRFLGGRSINFNENFFEANQGEYEVRFVPDPVSGSGTYGVSMDNNWFSRNRSTNRAIVGVESVFTPMLFTNNNGNIARPDGKAQYISDGIHGRDSDVGVYENNPIVGYTGSMS